MSAQLFEPIPLLEHEDGIYYDMPDAEYRKIKRLSNSMLKYGDIAEGFTMSHLKSAYDGDREFKDTDALAFGRAVHMRLLEPKRFNEVYALQDDYDGRTKEGKAYAAKWAAENQGKEPLAASDSKIAEGIAKSIAEHKDARRTIKCAGGHEVVILWTDPSGIKMKARLDKLIDGDFFIILDIKSTVSLADRVLQNALYKYGYYRQAALYTDAAKAHRQKTPRFYFLFVEKKSPYKIRMIRLDDRGIQIGRASYKAILQQWANCLKTGIYPDFGANVETMSLPAWVEKEWETMAEEESENGN